MLTTWVDAQQDGYYLLLTNGLVLPGTKLQVGYWVVQQAGSENRNWANHSGWVS